MEIYIHVPFCKRKCLYCDFNSYQNCDKELFLRYLTALNCEIELAGRAFENYENKRKITSVFIGGGTPSLLDCENIKTILENVKNHFDVVDGAEISIEANPESLTEEKLAAYRSFGINRLSIGVQSLYDDNLRAIGRIHDAQTAKNVVNLARKYFGNLSCDLMIGLPYDSAERVREEIEYLAPILDHISVYQLIVEEGTPLAGLVESGKIAIPTDDETIDFMHTAVDTLARLGFVRYEVSNFAKNGKYSRHNYGYWTREEYVGFGAGAASYLRLVDGVSAEKEVRFSSKKSILDYSNGVDAASDFFAVERDEYCELSQSEINDEKIMLGLRTSGGVEKSILPQSLYEKYSKYFVEDGDLVRLSNEGFDVMNTILVELMSFDD